VARTNTKTSRPRKKRKNGVKVRRLELGMGVPSFQGPNHTRPSPVDIWYLTGEKDLASPVPAPPSTLIDQVLCTFITVSSASSASSGAIFASTNCRRVRRIRAGCGTDVASVLWGIVAVGHGRPSLQSREVGSRSAAGTRFRSLKIWIRCYPVSSHLARRQCPTQYLRIQGPDAVDMWS